MCLRPPAVQASWASGFAEKVFPILLHIEDKLGVLHDKDNGRPNWSVATMVGILLLAEFLDLTDKAAVECLKFDLRWQHALALRPEDAYLSQRSLTDFRARLAAQPNDALVHTIFDAISAAARADLGLRHDRMRLDSTKIVSNVQVKGRVHLFSTTIKHFLRILERTSAEQLNLLSKPLRAWYGQPADGDEDPRDAVTRLEHLAAWLYEIKLTFAETLGRAAAVRPIHADRPSTRGRSERRRFGHAPSAPPGPIAS